MQTPVPERRDLHFDLPAERICDWHSAGGYVSQFFNTMSLFFPEGERFFISSVRHYRNQITDPTLQTAVTAFIGQEAMHGREHTAFNRLLDTAGIPAQSLETATAKRLAIAQKRLSPAAQLAMTIALEHLTAIMGDKLLRDPKVLAGAEPQYGRLWRWHALEETEHKSVAYDVWRSVMPPTLKSYCIRTWWLLFSSLHFWFYTFFYHCQMVYHVKPAEGHWRGYGRLFKFLFINPAVWLSLVPAWFSYFKPHFHPWQHDNRDLLEELDSPTWQQP